MNSILQCLSNTRELRDYCLQRLYMRDLGHTSSSHTALMEGEEPRVGVALLRSLLCSDLPGRADTCVLGTLHPSIVLSLPVVHWDSFQNLLFETQPCYVTLVGPKLVILLPQPSECWDHRCSAPCPTPVLGFHLVCSLVG